MARFLATNGISYITEGILMSANETLMLVMEELKYHALLFSRLAEASERGVDIKLVYARHSLSTDELLGLLSLPNVELFHQQQVKACCCFNEKHMLLSSMNMADLADKAARHMGMLIDREQDPGLYKEVLQETCAMLYTAQKASELAACL